MGRLSGGTVIQELAAELPGAVRDMPPLRHIFFPHGHPVALCGHRHAGGPRGPLNPSSRHCRACRSEARRMGLLP
jgi:hypothetical protein